MATDRLGRLLAPVIEQCGALRIEMKVVGDEQIGQALQATLEGDVVTVVPDLAQAKSGLVLNLFDLRRSDAFP